MLSLFLSSFAYTPRSADVHPSPSDLSTAMFFFSDRWVRVRFGGHLGYLPTIIILCVFTTKATEAHPKCDEYLEGD